MPRDPAPIELIELDIDTRLAILWQQIEPGETEFSLEFVAAMMRASYAYGYVDALKVSNPERWLREHGYAPPRRSA